jgi:hypothetical protein
MEILDLLPDEMNEFFSIYLVLPTALGNGVPEAEK